MGVKMMITRRGPLGAMLIVLMLLFVGCSDETPTAPTPGGGGGGGGSTPPVGAGVTVTVSNPTPIVSSTSTITATVTMNNQPVPDGTAVEFTTNLGTFTDTATAQTIRTTTGGVATAVLTSSTAGTATVTVRVNNVTRTVTVQFRADTTPPENRFAITSVSPTTSGPQGGDVVVIRGTNFVAPVRVLFGTREATVVGVSSTEIRAIIPAIDLGATEQFREVTITVINRAGTQAEESGTAPTPFRYEIAILTPVVYNVSPSSGPNEGNTRITIIGEGFQAPTRVYFGTGGSAGSSLIDQVELEVQNVTFGQIIAMTPPALGLGAPLRDQQVTMRVLNVNTNTDVVIQRAFRYGPGMAITSVGPTEASFLGGTRVTITGWGFDDPVAVVLGGKAVQPIRVSGTEIVVVTPRVDVAGCSGGSGPVSVTNIEDGASATAEGIVFEYTVPQPTIISFIPSDPVAGTPITVTVQNAGSGNVRFQIGNTTVFPSSATIDAAGTGTFTLTVPTDVDFNTEACPGGGQRDIPTRLSIFFENLETGCTTTLQNALLVRPPQVGRLTVAPNALTFSAVEGTTQTLPFVLANTGNGPVTIAGATVTPAGSPFTINVPAPTVLQPCESITATATFAPPVDADTTSNSSAAVATIDGDVNDVSITLTGTSTEPPAGP